MTDAEYHDPRDEFASLLAKLPGEMSLTRSVIQGLLHGDSEQETKWTQTLTLLLAVQGLEARVLELEAHAGLRPNTWGQ